MSSSDESCEASYHLSEIEYPGFHVLLHVLCGRGGHAISHPGNVLFRTLVEKFKSHYVQVSRYEKAQVTADVVRMWQTQSPSGRFLIMTDPSKGDASQWHDIGDKEASKKVAHLVARVEGKQKKMINNSRNRQIRYSMQIKFFPLSWGLCLLYFCSLLYRQNHSGCFFFVAEAVATTPALIIMASASRGPIRLRHGKYNGFSWQASVDSSTGIASSLEKTQRASPSSHLVRQFEGAPATEMGERQVWSDISHRLEQYPQWMVRGAVTLGLFHAVPEPGGGCSLRDRVFGINFLTFGAPQSQRFSMFKTVSVQPQKDGPTIYMPSRVGDCKVTIPIKGGFLALFKKKRMNGMGSLVFTVRHNDALKETQLITEILGYNPLLVGRKEPVPAYRKWMYLSSQSLIHAYVMWRFHRYCIRSKCTFPQEKSPPNTLDTNEIPTNMQTRFT